MSRPSVEPPARPEAPRAPRERGLDAARGVALGLMVGWHSIDAFLDLDARRAAPGVFRAVQHLGGLAAPLFLVAAGIGARMALRGGAKGPADLVYRGAELGFVGVGLSAWSWLVDDGGLLRAGQTLPGLLACAGIVGGALAARRRQLRGTTAGGLAVVSAAIAVHGAAPAAAAHLLRLDALHVIGVGVALCAGLRRVSPPALAVVGLVALATTPALRSLSVEIGELLRSPSAAAEGPWQWIARSPSTTSRWAVFPLFPWCAYALFGFAWASAEARRSQARPIDAERAGAHGERETQRGDARGTDDARGAIGWGAIAVGATIASAPGAGLARAVTDAPLRCAVHHCLVAMAALALIACVRRGSRWVSHASSASPATDGLRDAARRDGASAVKRLAGATASRLSGLGRRSLVVYALHLPMTYGLLAAPLRGRLGPAGVALMSGLVTLTAVKFAGALQVQLGGARPALAGSSAPRGSHLRRWTRLQVRVIRGLMRTRSAGPTRPGLRGRRARETGPATSSPPPRRPPANTTTA